MERGKYTISIWQTFLMICLLVLAAYSMAQEPALDLRAEHSVVVQPQYDIDEQRLGGFERKRLAGVKMRGWSVGERFHVGQAKVADKWGFGFVYQRHDIVYGVNHRGIQISKQF